VRRGGVQLGQHFLIDDNLLEVIGGLAELDTADVVLEIGAGLGALTRYLAEHVAHVHAVELDRGLRTALEAVVGEGNVSLRFEDALAVDPRSFEPAPTKLVSNLPYSVATPVVLESLDRLPTVELWCVMVQREVADRFFARSSTKAYGAVSVLVQLVTRRTAFRPVSRTVFRPPPHVDSALVAFRRTGLPDDYQAVKRLVVAAFSHRRKTLANSLALAGHTRRDDAAAALEAVGLRPDVRAQMLAPPQYLELARLL
jgi:16S rRNA (adenine1518-N6/adenine1519-N6)-dimethyltransferase